MNLIDSQTILSNSISSFYVNNGNLSSSDLEREVINNTCLYILVKQHKKVQASKSIEDIIQTVLSEQLTKSTLINTFISAAEILYPENFNTLNKIFFFNTIEAFVSDENTWEELRKYFLRYHNKNIEENICEEIRFISKVQVVYKQNKFLKESFLTKTVLLTFTEDKLFLILKIDKEITTCKLKYNNNIKVYEDGYFEVGYDSDIKKQECKVFYNKSGEIIKLELNQYLKDLQFIFK